MLSSIIERNNTNDQNKSPYWEDTWKLKFNWEKYKVLHVASKDINGENK